TPCPSCFQSSRNRYDRFGSEAVILPQITGPAALAESSHSFIFLATVSVRPEPDAHKNALPT
ncbi:MAG: hypothetical protein OEU60_08385, partial [Gammaproteobacteria bacterium]|nr:hypothetical protein [Gammaproteobacteria bacterium]